MQPSCPKFDYVFNPMIKACEDDNYKVVKFLIKYNNNINTIETDNTPFHIMCSKEYTRKRLKIIKLMLNNEANLNDIPNKYGYYPLHLACLKNNISLVKLLIIYGSDVNIESVNLKITPLYIAAKINSKIMKVLLQNKASVYTKNINGDFVFESSIFNIKSMHLLLKHDMYLNYNDDFLLHRVIIHYYKNYFNNKNKKNYISAIMLLLDIGADEHLKNTDNESAYELALRLNNNIDLEWLLTLFDNYRKSIMYITKRYINNKLHVKKNN